MASKPKKRNTKKEKRSTKADIEYIDQGGKAVPIRAIYFRHVPPKMTPNSLKLTLQELYAGPVQSVVLKSHRTPLPAAGPSHHSNKFAIVHFEHAATATAVLRQRKNWPNGTVIIANPANNQLAKDEITYSDRTRLRHLNDDCLLLLYDYLSFWDVVQLTQSSSQLLEFATENAVFEKYAREGQLPEPDSHQHISLALLDKTMKLLGPHLTKLDLDGLPVGRQNVEQCIQSVLVHSPQLASLRLTDIHVYNKRRGQQPLGPHCDKLQELCLSNCTLGDCRWLWALLDRAKSLEVLALHDCGEDEYEQFIRRYPKKMFKCPKLHTLSMSCTENNSKLLLELVRAHRATLRHLYFDLIGSFDYAKCYVTVCKELPELESILVVPDITGPSGLEHLSKLRHLRKLVIRSGDARSLGWLKSLATGPSPVQHLVLLDMSLTPEVCSIVGELGAKLQTLELYYVKFRDSDAQQQLGAKLQHLRTLKVHNGPASVDHLFPAVVQASAELEHLVFTGSWVDTSCMQATLTALRTALDAAAAASSSAANASGGANKRRVSLTITELFKAKCSELLLANADIVSWNGKPISDRHPPVEEFYYMPGYTAGAFGSDDYDSDINNYDMFDDDLDDDDDDYDYDTDEFEVYEVFNNENGFMAGNAFLNEIMRDL